MLALSVVVLLGMASLSIDIGRLFDTRTKLQATADAVALAAVQEVPDEFQVRAVAHQYAGLNENGDGTVLVDDDIELGHWEIGTRTFFPNQAPRDAVRIRVRRSSANGNPVPTWFARVLGIEAVNVEAEAIAARSEGGAGSRFLIDQEMIDSDEPAIQALATRLGKKPEDIISDLDDDWFIDLPVGETLELATGQEGDAGIFDFNHPDFPFGAGTEPSFEDFLNYNEDSNSWRYDLVPKEMLDPLFGVVPVEDPSLYPSYVNPNCQVSPVYKSDISANDPINGSPPVNALGLRRGLLAFKILSIGIDPDGRGSVLPRIIIEVCAPSTDLSTVGPGAVGGGIRLVR